MTALTAVGLLRFENGLSAGTSFRDSCCRSNRSLKIEPRVMHVPICGSAMYEVRLPPGNILRSGQAKPKNTPVAPVCGGHMQNTASAELSSSAQCSKEDYDDVSPLHAPTSSPLLVRAVTVIPVSMFTSEETMSIAPGTDGGVTRIPTII